MQLSLKHCFQLVRAIMSGLESGALFKERPLSFGLAGGGVNLVLGCPVGS